MKKINSHFVSDIDRMLAEFDQNHPESNAQRIEREKYQQIHQQRDQITNEPPQEDKNLWD
jgi:hypothetical protein